MLEENRVAWTEGMFLRVHHFQQADRWTERVVRATTRELQPYPWGFAECAVDRESLAVGRFALSYARGLFADGTSFEAPGDADLPPPLELVEGARDVLVHLALPSRQPGVAEMGDGRPADTGTRYRRSDYAAADANADSFLDSDIAVGRLRLSFAPSTGPLAGLEKLPVARIVEVRSDLAVVLDDKFIAPALNCAAQAARIHPEEFYRFCLAAAGELSTFTAASKRASRYPDYRHDDLRASFAAVYADLRASLSAVLEQTAVPIELQERRHGVRVGTVEDRSLILQAGFVLAVRANMPAEQLRRQLPNQIKVGPVEQIAQLVNVALPGVPVRPLSVAPRQLPYRNGTVYFELDTAAALWRELAASGALAIHVAGSFPEIELELWAIRG